VGTKLTLLKWGLGSPSRFSKFQSSIAKFKTLRIGVFFISLESYQSVNVKNELAWAIWTFATHVMAKRRVKNQTSSLTLDHYKSGIDLTLVRAGGVRLHHWKALEESYKFILDLIPIRGLSKKL